MSVDLDRRVAEFKPTVEKVSRFAAKRYTDVDWEDVAQELYIELLKNMKIQSPEEEDSNAFMALSNLAKRVVQQIRGDNLHVSVQYSYSPDDVARLLDTALFYEDWAGGWVPGDAKEDDSYSDDLALRADVIWAFDLLIPSYQFALVSRYKEGDLPPHGSPEKQTLDRAHEKLVEILNSYTRGRKGGPGDRKVVNNATAQYILDNQER